MKINTSILLFTLVVFFSSIKLSSQMMRRWKSWNSRVAPASYPPIRFYQDVHGNLQPIEGQVIAGIDRGFIIGVVINDSLRPVHDAHQQRIIVLLKNNRSFPVDLGLAEHNPEGVRARRTARIFLPPMEHNDGHHVEHHVEPNLGHGFPGH